MTIPEGTADTDGGSAGAPRAIRSFVLRQGRLSPAQQRACEALLPRYGVPAGTPLEWRAIFARSAPVVLEIGFGMGETTATIAAAQPHVDFLGVEMHLPGVGALLRDELFRRRPADDYSYTDWLYGGPPSPRGL